VNRVRERRGFIADNSLDRTRFRLRGSMRAGYGASRRRPRAWMRNIYSAIAPSPCVRRSYDLNSVDDLANTPGSIPSQQDAEFH
jgi:hypothetical protein